MKKIIFCFVLCLLIIPYNVIAINNYDVNLIENNLYENNSVNENIDEDKRGEELFLALSIAGIVIVILLIVIKKLINKIDLSDAYNAYGYNGKRIDKENIPMFWDIPCNKDIYYANALIKLNDFDYKRNNIVGAIILKWVDENKIKVRNVNTTIFNFETSVLDITSSCEFDNKEEEKLFCMMKDASKDGILEPYEFENWCIYNYDNFSNLVYSISNNMIDDLKEKGYIYEPIDVDKSKYFYYMNDKIYKDSIELYGLKKFLLEFSKMDTKEVIDVKLWNEYLMFAYLFGISDLVNDQLNYLYPDELTRFDTFNYDFVKFVDRCTTALAIDDSEDDVKNFVK